MKYKHIQLLIVAISCTAILVGGVVKIEASGQKEIITGKSAVAFSSLDNSLLTASKASVLPVTNASVTKDSTAIVENGMITAGISSILDTSNTVASNTTTDQAAQNSTTAADTTATQTATDAATVQAVADAAAAQAVPTTICGYTNLGIAHVDNNLNVREAADENSKLVGQMPKNAGCEIIEVTGDWAHIKSGSVEGYVKTQYLYMGDEAKTIASQVMYTMATVTTTTLKVRQNPSLDAEVMTLIPAGEELEVLEDTGEWVKVSVDGEEGYISKEFVSISSELDKAVTLTELQYGEGVSNVRVDLVQFAKQFVGNRYVWGGTSLTKGADCSGFVLSVFGNYGVSLPHSSKAQAGYGTKISASEAKPGDLFFYGNGSSISHVAIYIGNGQVVHASSARTGIKISNAFYRNPITVRSLLN